MRGQPAADHRVALTWTVLVDARVHDSLNCASRIRRRDGAQVAVVGAALGLHMGVV